MTDFISLDYIPNRGVTRFYDIPVFNFLRDIHGIFNHCCTNLHSHPTVYTDSLSTSLPTLSRRTLFRMATLTSIQFDFSMVLLPFNQYFHILAIMTSLGRCLFRSFVSWLISLSGLFWGPVNFAVHALMNAFSNGHYSISWM